jgi:hypothetical protein
VATPASSLEASGGCAVSSASDKAERAHTKRTRACRLLQPGRHSTRRSLKAGSVLSPSTRASTAPPRAWRCRATSPRASLPVSSRGSAATRPPRTRARPQPDALLRGWQRLLRKSKSTADGA